MENFQTLENICNIIPAGNYMLKVANRTLEQGVEYAQS